MSDLQASPSPTSPRRVATLREVLENGMMVIGPDRGRLTLAALLSFVTGLLETILLYLIAAIAMAMSGTRPLVKIGPGDGWVQLTVPSATIIAGGVVVALLVISFPLSTLLASLSSRAMVRLRTRMLHAYLRSSLVYRDTHREGLLQQLVGEYSLRAENSVQQLATFCVTVCSLAVVLTGAVFITPVVAAGMFVGLALTGLILIPVTKMIASGATTPILTNREVVQRVAQATRVSEDIAAYNVGDAVSDQLGRGVRQAAGAMHKQRFEGRIVPNLYQYGTIGVVLIIIGVLSTWQPSYLAGLAPLALLLIRALTYVRQMQRALHVAREMAPYISALDHEITELEDNVAPKGHVALPTFEGLRFERVDYAYKPGELVLRDVNFAIQPGEMIGIVGPSGSGKSTLSGLLLRLREPTAGRITCGSTPLIDVSAEAWAGLSAFVPQDSRLLFGTVAENILFYREGFTRDAIESAAKAAHLHEEIMRLPEGYDTLIGLGARGLSGGQRQRLAIARALLARPQLIVMDEPTSALDQRSELLVSQTLEELKGSVTIILIAHRPATLTICDRIFRVTRGVMTEDPAPRHLPQSAG